MSLQPEEGGHRSRRRMVVALLPLAVFLGIAFVAGKMLYEQEVDGKNTSEIPSALIGTRAPSLALPALEGANRPALTDAAIRGKLTLVNVFASWCIPCREEHPMLMRLAQDKRITLVGINYKDRNDNALSFLSTLGNPFAAIGIDAKGEAAIDWGVYGVPETYLVSPDGVILYKRVGPIDEQSLASQVYPAIEKALGASGLSGGAPAG